MLSNLKNCLGKRYLFSLTSSILDTVWKRKIDDGVVHSCGNVCFTMIGETNQVCLKMAMERLKDSPR